MYECRLNFVDNHASTIKQCQYFQLNVLYRKRSREQQQKINYSPEVSARLVPIVHVAPSENLSALLSAFFDLPFRHLTVHCTRAIYWLLRQPYFVFK